MRPHDLLRLADGTGLRHEGSVPSLGAHVADPGALGRRAPCTCAGWPHPRRGARAHPRRTVRRLARAGRRRRARYPGGPRRARGLAPHAPRASDATLRVLDAVDELFSSLGLAWGPTGSVGFELATGVAAAGTASDLDVVVRAPEPWPLESAREIADHLNRLPTCVDAQLDTPAGAVMLTEYARGERVLLRTPDGPRLTWDPWRDATTDLRSA